LIRLGAFANKADALKDFWFVFDSFLVGLLVVDTWMLAVIFEVANTDSKGDVGNASFLKIIRACRMVRMARMVRLLRAMPELVVLIKGVAVAAKSVLFTGILLLCITYCFALILRMVTDDSDIGESYFRTVPKSMRTLLIAGCFPDLDQHIIDMGASSIFLALLFVMYILLATFMLLNMLMGILIDAVVIISNVEKEELTVNYVRQAMEGLLIDHADSNSDGMIDRAEFQALLLKPEVLNLIESIGVDVVGLVEMLNVIFKNKDSFTYGDLISLMLDLRSDNTCTIGIIVKLQKWIHHEFCKIEDHFMAAIHSEHHLTNRISHYANETQFAS
jgi:hypothetical protein